MNRFLTVLVASVLSPVLVSNASAAVIIGDVADARVFNNFGPFRNYLIWQSATVA